MRKMKKGYSTIIPIIIILFCFAGVLLSPNDPMIANVMNKFQNPSWVYPFGTDQMGRCVFSRIMSGGYITIGIVILSSTVVAVIGSIIGLLIGQQSVAKNIVIESILNAVTAIPPIAYLIIFIGIWGNSIPTMMVALTASLILRMIKLVKVLTEIEMSKAYIMCAVSCGASRLRILFGHVFPNIFREIVHFLCLLCAEMIMAISSFSFIGLTLGDNVIDWGSMLSSARSYMGMRSMLLFYPIIFIFMSTVSFNILGKKLEQEEKVDA